MKIRIIKNTQLGDIQLKSGTQVEVARDIGKELIRNKFAVSDEFVTLSEEISLEAKESLLDLPQNEILEKIKTVTNKETLAELTNDKRKKVRGAAIKRLSKTEILTKN